MAFLFNFCLCSALLIASIGVDLAAFNGSASDLIKFAREQMASFRKSPNFVHGTRQLLDSAAFEATLRTYRDLREKGEKFESEHVIVAFSIVSCNLCSDSEVSVVHKTEKVLVLTQTISSDFNFNAECASVGSDHPPFYFRYEDGNKADNVIFGWVATVKCSPFDANDFALMKEDVIFEELFPEPAVKYYSSEDPYGISVDGEPASRTNFLLSLALIGLIMIFMICVVQHNPRDGFDGNRYDGEDEVFEENQENQDNQENDIDRN